MTKKQSVTCIGELITDLYAERGGLLFRPSAGGAPANVAVGLAKLGVPAAFAGRVGDDSFGLFLQRELRRQRVDTGGIVLDVDHGTRLAFITLQRWGERAFEFWERHPADEQLAMSDLDLKALRRSSIVHVSSFLLLKEPARSTALALARRLSRSGATVSFDANLRLSLWPSRAEARRMMLRMVSYASILRLNADEAFLLTEHRTLATAARDLQARGPSLVAVTKGKEGCFLQSGPVGIFVEGFPVRAVDTTGCGDGFLAGLLATIAWAGPQLEALDERQLFAMGRFANAVGALTALRRGVFGALPTLGEVRAFLRAHP
jgi:sugar/nucleoside kinase (ribokinase family)